MTESNSPSSAPSASTFPSSVPTLSIPPTTSPSAGPTSPLSWAPSTSPTWVRYQDLKFINASNILGLTESGETVDLCHVACKDKVPQSLNFDQANQILTISASNQSVDLSSLASAGMRPNQHLEWHPDSKRLALTHSHVDVDLSRLVQHLKFSTESNFLSLSNSNDTIDLSEFVNQNGDEPQHLEFDQATGVLSMSGSNTTVNLSSLVSDRASNGPQQLNFDLSSKVLSLSGSNATVDFSNLFGDNEPDGTQHLRFDQTTQILSLSGSNMTVNLSSLVAADNIVSSHPRLTSIQATIDQIDGKATAPVGSRRLKSKGDQRPVVGYGEITNLKGWTIFNTGRIIGISIATSSRLTEGLLRVTLQDCTESDSQQVGSVQDTLTLGIGDGRAKAFRFANPIPIQSGTILCIDANRVGRIKSDDKDNVAAVEILIEQ